MGYGLIAGILSLHRNKATQIFQAVLWGRCSDIRRRRRWEMGPPFSASDPPRATSCLLKAGTQRSESARRRVGSSNDNGYYSHFSLWRSPVQSFQLSRPHSKSGIRWGRGEAFTAKKLLQNWWKLWVVQSCPTLCDPVVCSPPGSSIHGILQARILEWVVIPFSRGSSPPRDRTWVSHIVGRFFSLWAAETNSCNLRLKETQSFLNLVRGCYHFGDNSNQAT